MAACSCVDIASATVNAQRHAAPYDGTLGACRLISLATRMPKNLAVRDDALSGDKPVRRSPLLHTSHTVCCVSDSQVEQGADAASTPAAALVSVLSESMTAVGIAHLPRRVSWCPPAGCSSRR